ncbi:hypothetical protein ACFL1H_00170 [Nanoarchaeota archaeon]
MNIKRCKRGTVAETLLEPIIQIIIVFILIFIPMLLYINIIFSDDRMEREFLAKDLSLMMDAIYVSPGGISYDFSQELLSHYGYEFKEGVVYVKKLLSKKDDVYKYSRIRTTQSFLPDTSVPFIGSDIDLPYALNFVKGYAIGVNIATDLDKELDYVAKSGFVPDIKVNQVTLGLIYDNDNIIITAIAGNIKGDSNLKSVILNAKESDDLNILINIKQGDSNTIHFAEDNFGSHDLAVIIFRELNTRDISFELERGGSTKIDGPTIIIELDETTASRDFNEDKDSSLWNVRIIPDIIKGAINELYG